MTLGSTVLFQDGPMETPIPPDAVTSTSAATCPINFTIRTGLPNAPVTDKRDERCASTRCPTILIRGAPFIRTPGIKIGKTLSQRPIDSVGCRRCVRIFDGHKSHRTKLH